jgi:creatinine amidohydrolase
MIWDMLTTEELGNADRRRVVILPLAATEQHGPHLPLATDRLIAEGICHALDAALGERILVLPCPPFGYSAHHRGFAGTLTIPHEQMIRSAASVIDCVVADGFNRILILNAHGGNIALGGVLLESLGESHSCAHLALCSWWQVAAAGLQAITESGPGGTGHACEFETSLLLHLHPELVRRHKIAPDSKTPTFSWAESDMLHGAICRLQRSFSRMTGNGVFGDPTKASAEKGQRMMDAIVRSIAPIINDLYEIL